MTMRFGHTAERIAGVVSVFVPIDGDLAGIRTTALWIFIGVLTTMGVIYFLIWFFFQKLVVTNTRALLEIFRETVSDAKGTTLYKKITSRDKLSELLAGTRLLAKYLRDNRHQLEKQAAELEEKVLLRTEALENSHNQLRRQMRQRNRELLLFTTIAELATGFDPLQSILSRVLKKTLQAIPADGGAIYLKENEDYLQLVCRINASDFSERITSGNPITNNNLHEMGVKNDYSCKQIKILDESGQTITIPLCCRNNDQGLLLITGMDCNKFDESLRDLLLSIGNQIGITIESLQSIGALRKSGELLQSVFDGISDPLILLDVEGHLKMVNKAF